MTTPLPAAPSLEQLRKQAKDLVRERKAGPEPLKLSEAQREVARDYGFASWPRLKAYVERVSAHGPGLAHAFVDDVGYYEDRAEGLRSVVASGLENGIVVVRAHHPALADASDADIRAISIADARLVLAREHGFASWDGFRRHVEGLAESGEPFRRAFKAIEASDRTALARLLDRYPGLVTARGTNGNDLLGLAAGRRRNHALVRELLERGADPSSANDRGWTPLHQAGYGNDAELARLLLGRGRAHRSLRPRRGRDATGGSALLGQYERRRPARGTRDRSSQLAHRRRPRPARPHPRVGAATTGAWARPPVRRAASTGRTPASPSGSPRTIRRRSSTRRSCGPPRATA